MSKYDERAASIEDMRRAWPDKTDDELHEAIAAAGGTLTVRTVPLDELDGFEDDEDEDDRWPPYAEIEARAEAANAAEREVCGEP